MIATNPADYGVKSSINYGVKEMPAICLNELSNYNNGELVYKWFNLEDFSTAEEYSEAVYEWLKTCPTVSGYPCEEWNIADYENIPSQFVGDYCFDAEAFYTYKEMADQLEDGALEAYMYCFSAMPENLDEFNNKFLMATEYRNDTWHGFFVEIAEELVEQNGMLDGIPEEVARYFNYEMYGRDTYLNELTMHNGFVFWNH